MSGEPPARVPPVRPTPNAPRTYLSRRDRRQLGQLNNPLSSTEISREHLLAQTTDRPLLPAVTPPAKRSFTVIALAGVGETLVTAGLVLALFVVWQLYITTWEVAGTTATAVDSFTRSLVNKADQITENRRTDPPPSLTIGGHGQTFATLHVPRWDQMVIPVAEGTTADVLDTGYAGHYSRTQGPGMVGNFAVAGHRRSYGNSFRRVEELQVGDPLVVETPEAWLIYQVIGNEVVDPSNGGVIDPVPNKPGEKPTERLMTMTTCHPEYGNSERFIVYSKLSYWLPRGEGRPSALEGKI